MDLSKTLATLRQELSDLDHAIQILEGLVRGTPLQSQKPQRKQRYDKGRSKLDPALVKRVKELNDTLSLRQIAKVVAAEGYKSKSGKPLHQQTIRNIIFSVQ